MLSVAPGHPGAGGQQDTCDCAAVITRKGTCGKKEFPISNGTLTAVAPLYLHFTEVIVCTSEKYRGVQGGRANGSVYFCVLKKPEIMNSEASIQKYKRSKENKSQSIFLFSFNTNQIKQNK